ncbi:hypothetical protein J2T02_003518 [Chitinophaga terrae (ex Kim and Jung 2007)]|nr:hypothetical protein [Chitinophaga terrae (ex Kim and Jung 2007)]
MAASLMAPYFSVCCKIIVPNNNVQPAGSGFEAH